VLVLTSTRPRGCCTGTLQAAKQAVEGVPEVFQLVVGPGEAKAAVQIGRGQVAGTSTV
jgi:hypothetical protein